MRLKNDDKLGNVFRCVSVVLSGSICTAGWWGELSKKQ